MRTKTSTVSAPTMKKREGQSNLFSKMVLGIGATSLITSLVFGTVWPIVIAAVALFGILSFMNGLI